MNVPPYPTVKDRITYDFDAPFPGSRLFTCKESPFQEYLLQIFIIMNIFASISAAQEMKSILYFIC